MTQQKPVTLQINTAGAWRNVVRFNAADAAATDQILDAAATIATHADGVPSIRVVVIEGGYPEPLARWSKESGWVNLNGKALT